MLTLYQTEWCPSCHRVREVLTELGLTYTCVNVTESEEERPDVREVSGQPIVPVLVDDERVICESSAIIEHLRATYAPAPDAKRHAMRAAFRRSRVVESPPAEALSRLEEVLAAEGFVVLAKLHGPAISPHLDEGLWVIYAAVPAAAAKALREDPTAPSATAVPFSVSAADNGSRVSVVNPVALVWLFGEPPLTKNQRALRDRVYKVLDTL